MTTSRKPAAHKTAGGRTVAVEPVEAAADQPAVSPVARVVRTGSQATSGALLTGVLAAFVDLSSVQVLAIAAALTAVLSWAQNLAEAKGWIPTLTVKPSGGGDEGVVDLVVLLVVALVLFAIFGGVFLAKALWWVLIAAIVVACLRLILRRD